MDNQFATQLTWGGIVVYLIQWLKKTPLAPFISQYTDRLNRALAILASVLTSVGINWDFAATSGTLTITGLTLDHLAKFAFMCVQQFVIIEVIYRGAAKEKKAAFPSIEEILSSLSKTVTPPHPPSADDPVSKS